GAEIVGDVEERRHEQPVGGGPFFEDRLARTLGQRLGDEAALGADRNNDGVLDLLRLDQAENLGAKILRPVRPADAAARHLAEAQMHGFEPRRVDENLVERLWRRHRGERAAGGTYWAS